MGRKRRRRRDGSLKDRLHALGMERVGLLSLRFPGLPGCRPVAVHRRGLRRRALKVDDSLSQLFRSDTPEFKQYEEVTRRFPSSEFDVLVVVEGKTLLERDSIEKLRDLVTDLQLIDGTRGIISMFSARAAAGKRQRFRRRCFPNELPEGAAYDATGHSA